jgi:capsular exopolysaccharide synthesis family protein
VPSDARPSLLHDFNLDAPHTTETRRLFQALTRHHKGTEHLTLLTTSACRGEGKSTISCLLGIVAARVFQRRTLIVDGDMRRPTVHRLLGVKQAPGLADTLRGSVQAERAIVSVPLLPKLSLMPSGLARNPVSASYDDDQFHALLERLRPTFDLILIDAAPVVPVVEPLMMAEHVDGILIVVMAGRTPLNLVRRMRDILSPVAPKISGIVLNNATEGLPYFYDYKYYGYKPDAPRKRRDEAEGS